MTLSEPISLMSLSWTLPLELPWPSVLMLPRSPTWRSSSPGAPWVLLWGLTAWVGESASCLVSSVRRVDSTGELTVRAGRGAAVGVVAKGVDVHAALSVGVVARDVP
jgi:hypothetical protein